MRLDVLVDTLPNGTFVIRVRKQTRVAIGDDVASLLQRIVLDDERFEMPALAPVVGGTWGDRSLDGLWGPVRVEGPTLVWEPSLRYGVDAKVREPSIDDNLNVPATLELADGLRVVARIGHTARWGTRGAAGVGATCEFELWHTEGGPRVVRWVGKLEGAGFLRGNLSITSAQKSTRQNMRLEGSYTWYLLDTDRDADEVIVVVDGGPTVFDAEMFRIDFNALQVALGTPLQLDTLVGLDGPGNVVGGAGVHLGGNRPVKRRRSVDGPVPDDFSDGGWVPVFFERLAKAMHADDALPWSTACLAYLDSVADATLDGQYLKLHVGLEAFAKALLKKDEKITAPRFLVKDKDAWVKWVRAHAPELRDMLVDPEREDVFIGKVISAMNLPSSGVVADALSRLNPPLLVDEAALEEVQKRNIPAHHLTMNKPGVDYDIERDVPRRDILRALLASLMARGCGYDGALSGWVTADALAWKPQPDWWPVPSEAALAEAKIMFVCERAPRRMTTGRPRSRIRKKMMSRGQP